MIIMLSIISERLIPSRQHEANRITVVGAVKKRFRSLNRYSFINF